MHIRKSQQISSCQREEYSNMLKEKDE